jgi:hypothetical protein
MAANMLQQAGAKTAGLLKRWSAHESLHHATASSSSSSAHDAQQLPEWERFLCRGIIAFGAMVAALGVISNIKQLSGS